MDPRDGGPGMNGVLTWLTDPLNWSGPAGIPAQTVSHLWYSGLSLLVAALIVSPISSCGTSLATSGILSARPRWTAAASPRW